MDKKYCIAKTEETHHAKQATKRKKNIEQANKRKN